MDPQRSTVLSTGAVVVAAGAGSRFGAELPKALVLLGEHPLVTHATMRLALSAVVRGVVVTVPHSHADEAARAAQAGLDLAHVRTGLTVSLDVVDGEFSSRQASVAAGLAALDESHGVVLVHDAARPLAPPSLIRTLTEAVQAGDVAVVPGVPVSDTIRAVDPVDETRGDGVVDRSRLRAMQTPQAFRGDVLRRAHAAGADRAAEEAAAATDDAGLVEALGLPVRIVAGERAALKITNRHDLAVAELFLREGW